ncbi:MAG: cytochrome c3 family protein [Planctomycetota bacterium]|nr:cytochrome c3 family protein [Planctomycetota bacterium]
MSPRAASRRAMWGLWALPLAGLIAVVLTARGAAPGAGGKPKDAAAELGPALVVLGALEKDFEAVPFDHLAHAKMSQMWDGCVTCHHKPPHPDGRKGPSPVAAHPATAPAGQAAADTIPACKSCHAVTEADTSIRVPNLKGAYHRQCLNCHREWMGPKSCLICHKAKGAQAAKAAPSSGEVLSRMHPPIPEPDTRVYNQMRFMPADGANVLFRHKGHAEGFGIKCATCHRRNACSTCHSPKPEAAAPRPLHPGKSWTESHDPCVSCHQKDRCKHCHYKDQQPPPPPFDHKTTGQGLDKFHEKLPCRSCHPDMQDRASLTCSTPACHKAAPAVAFPMFRPGPVSAGAGDAPGPGDGPDPAASQPATRPIMMRIRH